MWGRRESGYSVLVAKPEGKRLHGQTRSRKEDDIEMHIKRSRKISHSLDECGWEQGQVMDYGEHGNVLLGCMKVLELFT
jgi:hypothetical protein